MKKWGTIFGLFLATYFVVWTLVYALLMGGDFQYYGRYLHLAWTSPGEIPAMIQFVALSCAIVAALVAWWRCGKKETVKS